MTNREFAQRIVDLLNSGFEADPCAMHALCINRVPCNQAMVDHPTIIVDTLSVKPERFTVGLIGILNGLFPFDQPLAIGMKFNVEERKLVGFEVVERTEPEAEKTL